jgi:outer membrane protein assembly factor BamB/orotate phosphoribosyltransferase
MSIDTLKRIIKDEVIVTNYRHDCQNVFEKNSWIFDFRKIILKPDSLELVTKLLYSQLSKLDNYQIVGMESAAIPLVTSLLQKAHQEGKSVNGLYIRKSRKKTGRYKLIEGEPNSNPAVLIDDLINTGSSIIKQIQILKELKIPIEQILTIVQFRSNSEYNFLIDNLKLSSLFFLKEFELSLDKKLGYVAEPALINWSVKSVSSSPFISAQKSTPAVKDGIIFHGAEDRTFRATQSKTGVGLWSYKCGRSTAGKSILSAAAINDQTVYFGSYDGRIHALDIETGSPRWVKLLCDSIGSSPVTAPEINKLFIGLEFSGQGNKGGVAAISLDTGEVMWKFELSAYTHATPLYIKEHQQVLIGGNEGVLYSFDANTGELQWKFETIGGSLYVGGGFGAGDIKLAPVFDQDTDNVGFSSMDGYVYVIKRKTGVLVFKTTPSHPDTTVAIGIWSQPLFTDTSIIYGGLDKLVYSFDKKTGKLLWCVETQGRIFASPVVHNTNIYIGSNDGGLYQISEKDGIILRKYQFPDRIVCPLALNDTNSSQAFVLTGDTTLHAITLKHD